MKRKVAEALNATFKVFYEAQTKFLVHIVRNSMASKTVYDISERLRYKFKKHPFVYLVDDLLGAFSQISQNVLYVEDVRSYIHYKIESIGGARAPRQAKG